MRRRFLYDLDKPVPLAFKALFPYLPSMRYPSKQAFIDDIETEWDNLNALLADLNNTDLLEPNVCAKWTIKDMPAPGVNSPLASSPISA